jgi:hypothetical protein
MRSLICLLLLAASPGAAQHSEAMLPAEDVAAILASEEYCRFRYDRTQIARYLALHPEAAEPDFDQRLARLERDQAASLEGRSGSEWTAHCGWIIVIAQETGFLK